MDEITTDCNGRSNLLVDQYSGCETSMVGYIQKFKNIDQERIENIKVYVVKVITVL